MACFLRDQAGYKPIRRCEHVTSMNPFWLVDVAKSNTAALWVVGSLATACVVVISRPLRRAPRWRAAVVGIAVMLFIAPVYAVVFDPWLATPWPSIYLTAAVAAGEFDWASALFERQFFLPPVAWGLLAAFAWHFGRRPFARRCSQTPPFA